MALTWNIDEARATILAQMAEANRLDEVIDGLSTETSTALARAEAAEATLASCNRARQAAEAENDRLRKQVAQAKVDGANEERSLHWMSENMEIAELREQVATLEALRDELDVTRDLLRSVPEHSAAWYADICDYLETLG